MARRVFLKLLVVGVVLAGCMEPGGGDDGSTLTTPDSDRRLGETWRTVLGESSWSSLSAACLAVDSAGELAYLVFRSGSDVRIAAVHLDRGELLWRSEMGRTVDGSGGYERPHLAQTCALSHDGGVFVIGGATSLTADGRTVERPLFVAFGTHDGREVWRHVPTDESMSSGRAVLAAPGGFLAVSEITARFGSALPAVIEQLDADTGHVGWSMPTGLADAAVLGADGMVVTVAGSDMSELRVRSHDVSTGVPLWNATLPFGGYFLGRMALSLDGGTLFFRVGDDGPTPERVAAMGVRDGEVLWRQEVPALGGACCGPLTSSDGIVMAGRVGEDHRMVRIATATGAFESSTLDVMEWAGNLAGGGVDANGGAFALLGTGTSDGFILAHYDVSTGVLTRSDPLPFRTGMMEHAVTVLEDGGIVMLALEDAFRDGGQRVLLLRHDIALA